MDAELRLLERTDRAAWLRAMHRAGRFTHDLLRPGDRVVIVRYWPDRPSDLDGFDGLVEGFDTYTYDHLGIERITEVNVRDQGMTWLCHEVKPYGC